MYILIEYILIYLLIGLIYVITNFGYINKRVEMAIFDDIEISYKYIKSSVTEKKIIKIIGFIMYILIFPVLLILQLLER
jgi:hypothetical protein